MYLLVISKKEEKPNKILMELDYDEVDNETSKDQAAVSANKDHVF